MGPHDRNRVVARATDLSTAGPPPTPQDFVVKPFERLIRRLVKPVPLAALLLQACAATNPPIPLASKVDLKAIQGGWYIVATIPNWFEKGMVAPYEPKTRLAFLCTLSLFGCPSEGFRSLKSLANACEFANPGLQSV